MWLTALAVLLAALPAGSVQSPAADGAPYDVVRLGDGQMTCEALVAEINALSADVQATQTALTTRATAMSRAATESAQRSQSMGSAMGLGSMAAGLIPGAGLVMGAISGLGMAGAQAQAAGQGQMLDEVDEMVAAASAIGPRTQRLEHLSEISRGKGC